MRDKRDPLAAAFLIAFLSWTVWSAMMDYVGAPFTHPVLRAAIRFLAVAGPAWLWLRTREPPDRPRVFTNAGAGVAVGLAVSLLLALAHIGSSFQPPAGVHSWLNIIFLSPVAEELLFRRVGVDGLRQCMSGWRAVLVSAAVFALFHAPWWTLSGEHSGGELARLLATMFVYGLVFGALYAATGSLWASLLPHWANNLIAESLRS